MENPQLVGLMLVLFVNVILGLYIFFKNTKNAMNRIFLLLTFSIALWSFATFLTILYYSNIFIYDLADKSTYLFGLFIALSFYLFAISYPYKSRSFSSGFILFFMVMTILFTYVAFFTNLFVINAYSENGFTFINHNFFTYILYSGVIFIPFILGMIELWKKMSEGDGIYKQHFLTLIILVGSSIALSLFFNLFLASFNNFDYIVVGPLSSILLSFAIMRMIISKD
jgi:hypothetical protein